LKKVKSTTLGFAYLAGLGMFIVASGAASPSQAQVAGAVCPAAGFDVCFPNVDAGAPNAACSATEPGAADVTACLGRICRGVASEPEPGFFAYCCAKGGSSRFDDFCVFVAQSECAAVAEQCADRCPPLGLLTGTVTLAPPPAACLDAYPPFVARVCASDSFCCTTSWDSICADEAIAARGR